MIVINLEYYKAANYSLIHNRIAICKSCELTNQSDSSLKNLQVVIEGEYVKTFRSKVLPFMKAGETIRLNDVEIIPDADKMLELTEGTKSYFNLKVLAEEEVIEEKSFELELMAFDQWLGTTILPQAIVSFVTPNHPELKPLIVEAANILKEKTGSSQFLEYQTGNTNDVRQQVAAVFAAIHQQGIVYRALPASFNEVGQRLTLPHDVITGKLGNCIELTVLFASVLESIGINCGIVFQKGHAYLAIWLVDDCYPYSICDDSAFIEKKCSRGIDEMMVLECTMVTRENTKFEEAIQVAEKNLNDRTKFEMLIDVRRSRLERFLPLPLRTKTDGKWKVESDGVEHDVCQIDYKEHDRFDLSRFTESKKERTKLDIWESKLLDFSLRNSLLNLSLSKRAIQFISFDIDRIEDILADGKEYEILAKPNVDFKVEGEDRLMHSKQAETLHQLITNDIEHQKLHTFQTEQASKNTLKNIYRGSRVAIEETGANSLFLSIGALRWYETDKSESPRFAPIILIPVEIVNKKGSYFIRTRDEETSINITLFEFLKQNYDIKVKGLEPLPTDEHGVDVPMIFALIRDALKDQKRWDVEEECILGTFSFSKFLMWNDVHNHREELLQNKVVNSLVNNRLTWTPQPVNLNLKDVDQELPPSNLALPVAVDSSQMAAVIEAGKGSSFILYGPPGTGKSQTITNLIANALFQGKRVLFVAEKMAALSVVQNRLAKIGLDPFCLEMHSNKVTKKHILEQLGKALAVTHIVSPNEYKDRAEKIFEHRKQLLSYLEGLHHVDEKDGLSLYDCIVRYEGIEGTVLEEFVENEKLDATLLRTGTCEIEDLLGSKLETQLKLVGQPSVNPLKGLRIDGSISRDQIVTILQESKDIIEKGIKDRSELDEIRKIKKELLRSNKETILNTNARALYDEWKAVKAKWFIPKFFAKRNFMEKLRVFDANVIADDVDSLLNNLLDYQEKHQRIEEIRCTLTHHLRIESQPDEMPSNDTLVEALEKLGRWISNKDKMHDWVHWCNYSRELRELGLDAIITAIEKNKYDASTIRHAFFKALYKCKAEKKINGNAMLSNFEGMIFDEKVKSYNNLTEEFQQLTQKELYARLAAKVPRLSDNLDSSSEIGFLNRNISKGGKGTSLRDLLDQIPSLLPRLCPCMLMSPMSVAQFLSLTQEKFDLVIFDEASQMPTSEAVGAIARGNALVVVGDPKQMPPTSFFTSTNVDEEEVAIDDMESILEDCRTLDIPSLQLNWHYRSRHESLIAFSNNEYYDGSLITFPSVDDQKTKVGYVPVDGYYEKGTKRSNRAEAIAIVQEIERRLLDEELRKKSIGVIAFSVAQQGMIEDLLQEKLDSDKNLKEFADSMYEPIFVKNLENVQGDERDIILFSIGYGPNKEGKVTMTFGPLNNAGGERRLNVAVSRARHEMIVYSTLKASQIDLNRSKARGVEGLKHFLEYAESQTLVKTSKANIQDTDSVVAEQIAAALEKEGYLTEVKVGRSMFKVDIAVSEKEAPEKYLLGILLDGNGYRDTQTTRDREIVQPSVLRSLNWKVMRVWSVDWFNNPNRVISRILEVLRDKESTLNIEEPRKMVFDISQEQVIEAPTKAIQYVSYTNNRRKNFNDNVIISDIIKVEQPIMLTTLAKKISTLRGMPRVIPSLMDDITTYVKYYHFMEKDRDSWVVWADEVSSKDYPWYRLEDTREIQDIPTIEIKNAIMEVITEQFAIGTEALTLIAAKKLGFSRRGTKVESSIQKALAQLKTENMIIEEGGKIKLP